MIKKAGSHFTNSEISIDYITKKVDFNHQVNSTNDQLAFFIHPFFYKLSLFLTCFLFFALYYDFFLLIETYSNYIFIMFFLAFSYLLLTLLTYYAIFYINGTYSRIIHTHSKHMRDVFGKTSAFLHYKKEKCIDLSIKIGQKYLIKGKKLYLFDYNFVTFQYQFLTKHKLTQFNSIHDKNEKIKNDAYCYSCVFTFNEPIKKGFLIYYS